MERFEIVVDIGEEVDERGRRALARVIRQAIERHRIEVGFRDDEPAILAVHAVTALGPDEVAADVAA